MTYLVITQPWIIEEDESRDCKEFKKVKIDVCKSEEEAIILTYKYKIRSLFSRNDPEDYHGDFNTISLKDMWNRYRNQKVTDEETVCDEIDLLWNKHIYNIKHDKRCTDHMFCNNDHNSSGDILMFYYQAIENIHTF